ncbi:Short-chain dehydrogenase/reductase SDR [Neofusicoccum parvum]|nr:Short-chain dehydrogenase/reductase SDR [Neofusicoccum parvum]
MSEAFTNEAFTLLSLGIAVVICRLAARIRTVGVKKLDYDDYLMCFVTVVYSFETATAYLVGTRYMGLANNGMTPDERAALDLSSHEASLRRSGSKAQVVGWCLYTLVLWLLKICMNACYSRLTYQLVYLEFRVKIGWALIGSTYIVVLLSILLGCPTFHKNWQIYPDPGNHCQPAVSEINCYVVLFLNIFTDLWLISIPIPMLWRSSIALKQKIGLTVLFGAGIFVMIAGIIRCAIILSNAETGAQQAGAWAVRESFVAVVINNLPFVYPALHRGVRRFASSSASAPSRARLSGSGGRQFEMGSGEHAHHRAIKSGGLGKGAGRRESVRSVATDDSRGRIVDLEGGAVGEDAASAATGRTGSGRSLEGWEGTA